MRSVRNIDFYTFIHLKKMPRRRDSYRNYAIAGGIAALLALLAFFALTAFVGVIAFTSDDDDDNGIKQEILTSNSGILIGTTSFGDCQSGVTIKNWRLQRTGNHVTFSLIGDCLNTTSTSSIDVDFNFTAFPNPYKTPSPTESSVDVVGTGSAQSDGGESAYVEIEGDSNEECIDMDLTFDSTVSEGSDVEFSFMCQYQL